MKTLFLFWPVGVLLLFGTGSLCAQNPASSARVYTLVDGSYFMDDCLICGRPSFARPMRGTFEISPIDETSAPRSYAVRRIDFHSDSPSPFIISGEGTYEIDPLAGVQNMVLNLKINGEEKIFTNDTKTIDRLWPMIDVHLVQTQQNLIQFFSMQISAAPFRELWFSVGNSFTTTNSGELIGSGDLLSLAGRVVKANGSLINRFGFMPSAGSLGIDAIDILPGAEILFSFNGDRFSETTGQIGHGDLLSDRGVIVYSNRTLVANFQPQGDLTDVGLDALHISSESEVFFSTSENFVSARIGQLSRGDILSFRQTGSTSTNRLHKTGKQLLSRFRPLNTETNHGLDALYLWPSGEIWFSTESGFEDQQFGPISEGDLLSDEGKIIFRNLELVSAFRPMEDLSNFGLDALQIVTDPVTNAPPPGFLTPSAANVDLTLNWIGEGRFFQVEKSTNAAGPYQPWSPVIPALTFMDPGALTNDTKAFYRLRQW